MTVCAARAVIHLGSRRHGAEDIESGRRVNLIVWNHNNAWRANNPTRRRNPDYEQEEGPPDPICLSLTHDRDFTAYREIPEWRKGKIHQGGVGSEPWCAPAHAEYVGFPSSVASPKR